MSSAAGPSIATSGLVLDIDMANTQKSWLGKPTTNYVDPKWVSWGIDGSGQATLGTRTILSIYDCIITDAVSNTRQSIYVLGLSGSTTYTFSVKFKRLGGAPTLRFQLQSYSGGTFLGSVFPTTVQLGLTDREGWQTASYTYTTAAGADRVLWFMQDGDDYTTYTHSFELKEPQAELGSFATPFVAGTRSNIQAIVDLTNNNTLTATSLTYAADNTFSFNGSSSVATSPTITLNLTAGVSMEMVFKSTDIQSRTQGYMSFSPGPKYINFYSAGTGALRWETWLTAGSVGGAFYGPTNLTNNTWYHAVGTYASDGTAKLYINGVLVNSAAYAATSYGSLTSTIRIGEYAGYFSGTMPVSKIYTRALSASEVSQNFNATRARYGL